MDGFRKKLEGIVRDESSILQNGLVPAFIMMEWFRITLSRRQDGRSTPRENPAQCPSHGVRNPPRFPRIYRVVQRGGGPVENVFRLLSLLFSFLTLD
mmetsp:Transcript_9056/g.22578  ORF Transcript_9056/g.22578 Transcript_9056/m.22578 type:complete len:97 (+) Transcript_9056:123-413(+)